MMKGTALLLALWALLGLANAANPAEGTLAAKRQRLSRKDRIKMAKEEQQKYIELRKSGIDEVSNTKEAAMLRNYRLRAKKRKGIIRKKQASLAQVLFPGVSPEEYQMGEDIAIYADLVESKKTQVPFEFYDLPSCPPPDLKRKRIRKNLGSRLQGHDLKPAPFSLRVQQDQGCTPLCVVKLGGNKLRWMRKLVERQYRVQLSLDQLPVLMRSKELNYAVRGYVSRLN
jgi:transmembrane 9 superfamily protein 2/4